MGEIADELAEMEVYGGYNFFNEFIPDDSVRKYDNTVWKDRFGRVQKFSEMDGFHLWNIRTFIIKSKNQGLKNKLYFIESALMEKKYGLEEYKNDCRRLKENGSI